MKHLSYKWSLRSMKTNVRETEKSPMCVHPGKSTQIIKKLLI